MESASSAEKEVDMGRLDGKVAIVTGAAMGMGRATAILFAEEGATVVMADIDERAGRSVVDEVPRTNGEATFMRLDITKEADWGRVVADTVERYEKLNVLVNNAGISGGLDDIEDTSLDEYEHVMRVNATGVFLGMKHAIGAMKTSRELCSIINRSSIYGQVGEATCFGYGASKGAVTVMTKSAALAMAAKGYRIRVNSVHPGFVRTPMVDQDARDLGLSTEEHYAALVAQTPMGLIGEPIDVAYLDLYLASDESRWMTGSELTIDGGFSAR